MKYSVHRNMDDYSSNVVADITCYIPDENNNADYVNDVLIKTIRDTGFYAINNEIRWCKDKKGRNILMYFGATEDRCSIYDVCNAIEAL